MRKLENIREKNIMNYHHMCLHWQMKHIRIWYHIAKINASSFQENQGQFRRKIFVQRRTSKRERERERNADQKNCTPSSKQALHGSARVMHYPIFLMLLLNADRTLVVVVVVAFVFLHPMCSGAARLLDLARLKLPNSSWTTFLVYLEKVSK